MSLRLQTFSIPPWNGKLPANVSDLLTAGQVAIDQFYVQTFRDKVPSFHASEMESAYRLLRAVVAQAESTRSSERPLLADRSRQPERPIRFVEWGAGIPIVSALAELIGCQAVAIESEPRLVDFARDWLLLQSSTVKIVSGSFIPTEYRPLFETESLQGIELPREQTQDTPLKECIGEIVYAYPWPGEAELIASLFSKIARRFDWLVMFHGSLEFSVQRMV